MAAPGRRPGAPRGCSQAGLTRLRTLPCIGCPASPPSRRAQPFPGSLGCGGTGSGRAERREIGAQVALRGAAAGRAAEGAGGRGHALPVTVPHRPAHPLPTPPGGGGRRGRCAGRWSRGARGDSGGARLPLPVRGHPRTSGRGCAWMPGPGWAAPVTCAGGREGGWR